MIRERKYKLYKKWFKLGFEHRKQNGFNPNHYHDIDTSYRLKYPYKCTFRERLPWNVHWTYLGYLDGYNAANPFNCHETIYNIDIRKIWNARLEHKKITKAEYYIYRPHEEVSDELAELLDKKYGFDGGVYYKDEPWWEDSYE